MTYDVAVIVPIFNTQDYLHRCIGSIISQQKINLQCLLIDDGSTDNSADIAKYYQRRDKRITFISKINEGQGPARNIGITLSRSEYVCFVDSDDYLSEGALNTLYETAKKSHLDLCSPAVPNHYFAKPLEYIACLPNKSQFIKRDILVRYNVLQPDARSGQDGVFSHLFLTHAARIGMNKSAQYNYTHAREGSTFHTYLKRSDLVADIVDQHYAAIMEHYEKWALWQKNAPRLLEFLVDETLKNRIIPHLPHMSEENARRSLVLLDRTAQKAAGYLSKAQMELLGPVQRLLLSGDVNKVREGLSNDALVKAQRKYDVSGNVTTGPLLICKYKDEKLIPVVDGAKKTPVAAVVDTAPLEDLSKKLDTISNLTRAVTALSGKVDFAINATLNSAAQTRLAFLDQGIHPFTGSPIDAVISLTSLPARLPILPFTLESIFSQTLSAKKVILWLSANSQIERSAKVLLKRFCDAGLELRFVEDVGPHTKLLYALAEFPDLPIITFDDDMLYPFNTVQYLWDQHLRHKGAVIANWARELAFDNDGKITGVRNGRLLTPPLLERKIEQDASFVAVPNMYALPYGTCGVLYPPGSLSDRAGDVRLFQRLCPKEDDLWFKAMSLLKGTPVVVTNLGINPPHYSVFGSQFEALRHFNHGAKQNAEQYQAVFDYFNLYSILGAPT